MMTLERDDMPVIGLWPYEVFDCYRAWRTKKDYERLKGALADNSSLVTKFRQYTHASADWLIYMVLRELDQYYAQDEWRDPVDVMFDVVAAYVPMGDLK